MVKVSGDVDNISNNLLIGAINEFNEEANAVKSQMVGMKLFPLLHDHTKPKVWEPL